MFGAGDLFSGALSLIGTSMTNDTNRDIANSANAAAYNNAKEQMNFQERMSNSAYQRARTDMEAAGINPMLAGINQSSASTPQGAMADVKIPHIEDALGRGVSSALEARRLRKELDSTDSQISLNEATRGAAATQALVNSASAKVADKKAELIDAQMPAVKAQARTDEKRAKLDEKAATYDAIANRVGQAAGIINDATSVLRPKIQIGPRSNTPVPPVPSKGSSDPRNWEKRSSTTNQIFDKKTGEIIHEY